MRYYLNYNNGFIDKNDYFVDSTVVRKDIQDDNPRWENWTDEKHGIYTLGGALAGASRHGLRQR